MRRLKRVYKIRIGIKMQNHSKSSLHLVSPVFISLLCFVINVVLAKSSEIYTEEVVYYKNQKNVVGYLARPIDGKRYPAILLIHEWWGLNENIKERARQFAGLGYVALAVDLYGGRVTTTASEARNLAGEVRNNRNDAFDNLKGAVDFLQSQSLFVISDRIASIGWCFGGGWSFEMAKNNLGVKVSVIYYGRFNSKDDLSKMRAVILGHFAEEDRVIRVESVREFQAKLRTMKGDHEIFIYPNTGHAFANPNSSNYNQEASELAWERTLHFLQKRL